MTFTSITCVREKENEHATRNDYRTSASKCLPHLRLYRRILGRVPTVRRHDDLVWVARKLARIPSANAAWGVPPLSRRLPVLWVVGLTFTDINDCAKRTLEMPKANDGAAQDATALDARDILQRQAGEKPKTGQTGALPVANREFLFTYRFGNAGYDEPMWYFGVWEFMLHDCGGANERLTFTSITQARP